MRIAHLAAGGAAVALAATAIAAPAAAAPAKTTSLAEVLTADGNRFDRNGSDYDVVTEAVLAVLEAKPDSPVKVLADGSVRLTAFVPTDRAFKRLAGALSGAPVRSEAKAFAAVAGLGIDTVETVLLYHVVPGATIPARKALKADGAALVTAQGGKIRVDVRGQRHARTIVLKDRDPDFKNPRVVVTDINKGNRQIAHGINGVLLPSDL